MPIQTVPETDLTYYLVCVDRTGSERADDPDGIDGHMIARVTEVLALEPCTDVFLMTHGWMGWRAVVAPSRDRVTIDLRGIGDAVRQAAIDRGATVAALARHALIDEIGPPPSAGPGPGSEARAPDLSTVKLTLRLLHTDAEALILAAGALGLSYGEYVAKLVHGTPLPAPAAERQADRAALLASTDRVAAVATDQRAFIRLLAKLDMRGLEPYRERMCSLDADIRHHIDLARCSKGRRPPAASRSRPRCKCKASSKTMRASPGHRAVERLARNDL